MKAQVNPNTHVPNYFRTQVSSLESLTAENYIPTTDDENIFMSDFVYTLSYLGSIFFLGFEAVYHIFIF
jgi:hypothetical protein